MSVTCFLSGRYGNIVFALANMVAYAKKHDLEYYCPTEALAYNHFRNGDIANPLIIKSTGHEPLNPIIYNEPNSSSGNPSYHEIPAMDNVMLEGYYQSFKYFDWCRDHILETFKFPYKMEKGIVSVSVRRGDCLQAPDAFPLAPPVYYHKAIEYMQERGYNLFRVHSDDQEWCKKEFTTENYPGATFDFAQGTERGNYLSIQNCEHNITARSTFSLTAAWFNRNPDKIVLNKLPLLFFSMSLMTCSMWLWSYSPLSLDGVGTNINIKSAWLTASLVLVVNLMLRFCSNSFTPGSFEINDLSLRLLTYFSFTSQPSTLYPFESNNSANESPKRPTPITDTFSFICFYFTYFINGSYTLLINA